MLAVSPANPLPFPYVKPTPKKRPSPNTTKKRCIWGRKGASPSDYPDALTGRFVSQLFDTRFHFFLKMSFVKEETDTFYL